MSALAEGGVSQYSPYLSACPRWSFVLSNVPLTVTSSAQPLPHPVISMQWLVIQNWGRGRGTHAVGIPGGASFSSSICFFVFTPSLSASAIPSSSFSVPSHPLLSWEENSTSLIRRPWMEPGSIPTQRGSWGLRFRLSVPHHNRPAIFHVFPRSGGFSKQGSEAAGTEPGVRPVTGISQGMNAQVLE